jgi:hypothetical protein
MQVFPNSHFIGRVQKSLSLGLALLVGAVALSQSRPAQAAIVGYNVNLNTSPLANSNLGGTGQDAFRFDFYYNDGGTPNSGNVTVSNFNFGTGTGTPATPSSFSDTPPTTDVNQNPVPTSSGTLTTPGNFLSFDLTFDYNVDTAFPDVFSFGLYNTTDGSYVFSDSFDDPISLFRINFTSGGPVVETSGSTDYSLAAPTVTATPEPQTWAMMMMGMGAFLFLLAKNKKRKAVTVAAPIEALRIG